MSPESNPTEIADWEARMISDIHKGLFEEVLGWKKYDEFQCWLRANCQSSDQIQRFAISFDLSVKGPATKLWVTYSVYSVDNGEFKIRPLHLIMTNPDDPPIDPGFLPVGLDGVPIFDSGLFKSR